MWVPVCYNEMYVIIRVSSWIEAIPYRNLVGLSKMYFVFLGQ